MKNIFVYVGKGAYQAKDVENFLAVFDYDYDRINEFEFDQLTPDNILIIPGGEIHAYLPAIKNNGIENIRRFVHSGGIYIGLCAGAYIAGSSYDGIPGLNFFPQVLDGGKTQATINVTENSGDKFQLINENGPDLSVIKPDQVLLKDDEDNAQMILINHGQGEVYLFAAHPEGSVYHKLLPYDFSGAKYFKKFIDDLIGN